ncbi:hypothetical protein [Intestinimonas butyriciproducens]|uniref:hypothetical protein n=1 Tax=Intestinimonas butyriciproducens TaxID=1297617 RepID=UPI00195EB4CA|nr:hypothetical protein [Intestinimonas butyriciproducens]MBM6978033.1 hypothetical protein [Intestinimonas butyriciproducens]
MELGQFTCPSSGENRGPRTAEPSGAEADVLYGVTMQEQGVSRLLTINLNDVERELKLK